MRHHSQGGDRRSHRQLHLHPPPSGDGEHYAAVTNVGTRPTLDNGADVTVEACILDFQGDLYGQTLRLEFYRHLRDEMRFDSLDALRARIAADAETTRRYFEENPV